MAELPQNDIIGRWEWVASEFIARGMDAPKKSDPESRGYTIILEFKESNIDIIKNGKLVETVSYRVEKTNGEYDMLWVEIPQDDFPFFIASGPLYFQADTLLISGSYNDAGENQTYKRLY